MKPAKIRDVYCSLKNFSALEFTAKLALLAVVEISLVFLVIRGTAVQAHAPPAGSIAQRQRLGIPVELPADAARVACLVIILLAWLGILP